MDKKSPLQNITFRNVFPRKMFILKTGIAFLFFISLFTVASAQTGTSGQLTGSVTDESGAVVPDATVKITQIGTGAERTAVTSNDGNYSFPNLDVGIYKISVTKNGFKETAVSDVAVNVANITRQNISLQTGEVSETVQITADAVQIETQTGAVGEVVTGEQVRELPLNGRSFVQLTQLQPGVAAANNFDSKNKGLFSGVDFSVNGNSAQSNLFLTDGANNNDTGSNRTILLYPSIEAIAEFKMLRNSYGPEYGQAAGSVITLVTRGGTNQFHGSLFYFGRNDALNATEFFAKRSGLEKDTLRRNDYGFSLGGPIIKDRLFFFYSQEWNKELRGQARFGRVPTAEERNGDFRRSLIPNTPCALPIIRNGRPGDLLGRNGDGIDDPNIPGNPNTTIDQVVPQGQMSQAGLTLVKIFPLANRAFDGNCNNWAESASSPIDFREENIRIDSNLNGSNKLFGRYTQDHWQNPYPIFLSGGLWGDDAYPTIESSWAQPSRQAAVKLTSTLSSTSVNDVQFSYSANRINVTPGRGGDLNEQINRAIPGYNVGLFSDAVKVNGINRPHPVFWGGIAPFNYGGGQDLWTQAPFKNSLDIYSIRDDFSKVMGNHTFKMGFLFDKAAKDEDSGPNNEAVQFWGACCGNNSANYLADVLTQGSLFGFNESNTQAVAETRYSNLEFYFGDTWKLKPNLTLELGTRYSIYYEPYDAKDEISSFSPALYNPARPATDPCNGLIVPKGSGNPCAAIAGASVPTEFSNRSLRENNYKNLAPRLGIAWDVFSNGKTAIRGGFGQFFLRERVSPVVAALTSNPPFSASISGQRTLDGSTYAGLPASAGFGSPRFAFSTDPATPYSLQFNVSVGQQLWQDSAIEVGYVGNRARNQITHFDLNQVVQQSQVAASFAADANAVNNFRPFKNFGSLYQFERNGVADYNSLQVLFRTKFLKNSQFQAAYTFSKSQADFGLNDSSGTTSTFAVLDSNNRDLDYAESDINRPHIFVANLIYNLPQFDGSNAFVKNILGGWEVATIVQIASGTSLTPQLNATGMQYIYALDQNNNPLTRAFQGGITGTGTNVANQRPLRVDGVSCEGTGDITSFLNPGAFTLVGYQIGQTIPKKTTCLGSPTKNVDMSFYKNFTPSWLKSSFLGEGARIQLRLEMFNAFNTPQFRGDSLPLLFYNGTVRCGGTGGVCDAAHNTITSFDGGAGNFGVAGRSRGGREIQYALKLVF